mgnify:CR=1 FL=1
MLFTPDGWREVFTLEEMIGLEGDKGIRVGIVAGMGVITQEVCVE